MKEKNRQRLLRAINWQQSSTGKPVYVPIGVRETLKRPELCFGATIDEATALGAVNLRPQDHQLVADWPQHYFTSPTRGDAPPDPVWAQAVNTCFGTNAGVLLQHPDLLSETEVGMIQRECSRITSDLLDHN